ncbi:LPP20 family lipoprotein [candidate division KSB1 bacterium]|nr:LPP20 family lipoprotein [candidate division KSB1 bacterium]
MKIHQMLVIGVILMAFVATPALTQGVSQQIGNAGVVDWSTQMLRATGIGSPNPNMPETAQRAGAIEAAKRVALRNLLETIQGMNLDSETTVRNYMMESDVVTTRVRGIARNFTVVDTKYMSDGSIEVTVEMPVTGALLDALLPSSMGGALGLAPAAQGLCPLCGQPWPAGRPVPAGVTLLQGTGTAQQGQVPQQQSGAYTGLVIEAKGLGLRPAMSPKILDESGQEIYGSKYVSREWAVQIGMVGYDKDVNRARNNDRVTDNPLVVKALKASGDNKADVVVTSANAAMIQNAAASQNFLDKCRVMFIVD